MTIPHEPWLVALSIAIAIQGSFVGLSLARELDSAEGFRRRLVLAGSALTLATGVWSMHFVGMLAANFPSAIDYLVLPTLISFLICVIVVGAASMRRMPAGSPPCVSASAASAMGLGVSLMHYVGMSAVHLAGPTWHEPPYRRRRGRGRDRRQRFRPVGAGQPAHTAAAVPRRGGARSGDFRHALHRDGGDAARPAVLRCLALRRAPNRRCRATRWRCSPRSSHSASRAAFFFRLCPTRAPPDRRRPAPDLSPRQPRRSRRRRRIVDPDPPPFPPRRRLARAASFRSKRTDARANSPSLEIYAIRANAHYTYVHDGEQEYFCNLSISALEARLDPKAFLRVHRSYIVSVDRIARVKRSGEAGVAELGLPVRCSIPIARAHYRQVKLRIGALAG